MYYFFSLNSLSRICQFLQVAKCKIFKSVGKKKNVLFPTYFFSLFQRLREHLLTDYDNLTHPVYEHDKPVNVSVGMAVMHVDIDETKSIMKVIAWMR